ncbi:MAG TPA: T9SS type A sorting domain-containing protein, partial [Candidatus Kapabacteria bacterium]|nr:T9SS type A sorting domain-containing protein [Candidatus Kapabacteria bacterium]
DYVFSSANDGYRNLQSTSSIDLSGIFKPTVLYATSGVITSSGNPSESQGHIFPNPSTGGFTIVPPDGGGEISRIDLLDEAGHVVADLTRSVVSDADGIHVKSGGLAAGTYFVRVEAKGGEYLYKIVIDHGVK